MSFWAASEGAQTGETTSIALIIPSVNRPGPLATALASVAEHDHGRIEVLVVARADDAPTQAVAHQHGARVVTVTAPGLAHAMQAGAQAASADVVAFTDDDAELLPGWLERLEEHYDDPSVGAVGGRDVQTDAPADTTVDLRVGTVHWNGHVIGGHHTAIGPARDVDHLKGVNCSFRRELFTGQDASALIYGQGAQARNELIVCLAVAARGFRIVFDPQLQVLHSPAPRAAGDTREASRSKIYEAVYNEAVAFHLARHPLRWRNTLMLSVVGYRSAPGLLRCLTRSSPRDVAVTLQALARAISHARSQRHRH